MCGDKRAVGSRHPLPPPHTSIIDKTRPTINILPHTYNARMFVMTSMAMGNGYIHYTYHCYRQNSTHNISARGGGVYTPFPIRVFGQDDFPLRGGGYPPIPLRKIPLKNRYFRSKNSIVCLFSYIFSPF